MDGNHDDEIKEMVKTIEEELFLLGTTALEDKLQENVHECIEEFRRADIKVWMITGDKLETAENVGVSCRLLHEDAERMFLTEKNSKNAKNIARNVYSYIKKRIRDNKKIQQKEDFVEDEDESSFDLERESEQEPPLEENKEIGSNKNLNTSFHTQQPHSQSHKIFPTKKVMFHEQFSTSDVNSKSKKLGINEK